jgi:GntR family transcriptional regulator
MQIHISQDSGEPIYQQIVRQVQMQIATGRLAAEDQLPSVRSLAERILVNPNTVARAYRELESAGAVTSRRGSGVFVSSGGSPLSRKERHRILNEKLDGVLAEASQLDIDAETVIEMLRERQKRFLARQKGDA